MIIDLEQFIREAQPRWRALEQFVLRLEDDPLASLDLAEAQRLHYLYERTASDLARLTTFAFDPETQRYLESLIGRAYALIHDSRGSTRRFRPVHWFCAVLPRVFRRRWRALAAAVGATLAGALFGAILIAQNPELRTAIMPFPHLHTHPAERVAAEEASPPEALASQRATFSSSLMTHNTRVAIFAMALGITWGFGTLLILFYNGVIIGAVAADYIMAGETLFLLGWLLPHGAIEIPAFLIAGQAGLILANTLIRRDAHYSLAHRLRRQAPGLATLIGGVTLLLVWAAIVEAFFSQYHEPVLPYPLKIAIGIAQFVALGVFLLAGGRRPDRNTPARDGS